MSKNYHQCFFSATTFVCECALFIMGMLCTSVFRTIRNVLWFADPHAQSSDDLRHSPWITTFSHHQQRLSFVNRLRTQRTFHFPKVTFQMTGIDDDGGRIMERREHSLVVHALKHPEIAFLHPDWHNVELPPKESCDEWQVLHRMAGYFWGTCFRSLRRIANRY